MGCFRICCGESKGIIGIIILLGDCVVLIARVWREIGMSRCEREIGS